MTRALAATAPWWEPGTRHGYHAITFGYLVGEVIRRVTGASVGRFLREQVTGPLDADFFIGVPESADARAAEVLPSPPSRPDDPTIFDLIMREPASMAARAFNNPPRTPAMTNTRAWRAAEIPAANGHTTARAVARVYGALGGSAVDGIRLLEPATIAAATVEQSAGADAVLGIHTRFGLGFMLRGEAPFDFGPSPRAFGHLGVGGSIGFADPDTRLGFGYVTNQYQTGTRKRPDLRWHSLVERAYAALGKP